MSLNESIVEDSALEWFGELGYADGHGPQLAPAPAFSSFASRYTCQAAKQHLRTSV